MTSESLGVKEQAFLEFSQAGSDASAGTSPSEGSAWAVSAARSVGSAAVGGWLWSSGWGLCPKDRFPRRGVGLGVGLGKQFSLPKCVRENECLDRFFGALRRVVRPVAARLQARQTECGVALQMFVAGLATDAELFAQLGHGKAPATGEYNESIDLFHIGYVGPGHRPMCNLSPRIKCHLSRRIEPSYVLDFVFAETRSESELGTAVFAPTVGKMREIRSGVKYPGYELLTLRAMTCIRSGDCAVCQESIRDPCSYLLDGRRGQPRDVVEFVEIRELPTIARN